MRLSLVMLPLLLSAPAFGAFLQNATGLPSPGATITFDEHVFARSTPITTQYSDLGVSFTPALSYDVILNDFPTVQGHRVGNVGFPSPFTILFNTPVRSAAFGAASNTSNTTFEALLGSVVVESAVAITNTSDPNSFFGFEGIAFNAIRVTQQVISGSGGMVIDNIQFSVPAPGVSGAVLMALAAYRPRRRLRG